MAITYMQRRRSGTYEFRKRLPDSMAAKPAPEHVRHAYPDLVNPVTGAFKREIVRSLKTKDSATARKADMKVAYETQEMFDQAKALMVSGPRLVTPPQPVSTITPADLEAIEAEALRDCLRQDDAARKQDYRMTDQGKADRAGLPHMRDLSNAAPWGLNSDSHQIVGHGIGILREDFRDFNARQDPSRVEAEVRVALRSRGIKLDPKSEEFRDVGLAIIRGTLHAYNLLLDRQEGDTIPTPPPPAPPIFRGPKLSEAHVTWQNGGGASGAKKPGRSALNEAKPSVRRFIELHGDLRLGDITKAHARQYRDALTMMPKGLPKKIASLPLPEILKRDLLKQYPRRDAATVNKMLDMMSAIVSRAKREGELDAVTGYVNPFDRDVKLREDPQSKDPRETLDSSDLKRLFDSPVFTQGVRPVGGGEEAAFWFPIIGLTTGMRLDEIAGLHIADLRQHNASDGWFYDLHWKGERGLKNTGSKRLVPVHPAVIEIGLLRYRQSLLDAGAKEDGSLWPAVNSAPGRPQSASWSQWFGRYLRRVVGISDRTKVFHSSRHTFKETAREACVPEEVHDALTGHSGGSVGRGYGKVTAKTRTAAMKTIEIPEVLAVLRWQAGELPDRPARPVVERRSSSGNS